MVDCISRSGKSFYSFGLKVSDNKGSFKTSSTKLTAEEVASFLAKDYNIDSVKTSKLTRFEKFIYLITFGLCNISSDKRKDLERVFTKFEETFELEAARNSKLHSDSLAESTESTEPTDLADYNSRTQINTPCKVERFAKLARLSLEISKDNLAVSEELKNVKLNMFELVFEPSSYGISNDQLKFMIGNTCITSIDCDRQTRKRLIKILSERPDLHEHLNVKKLYTDDHELVKQYDFQQKQEILYLGGRLYGAKTGAGDSREYHPVGKGAYGTVYVEKERVESKSNKSSDRTRLAKKFEIVKQSDSNKESNNCASKLVANLKKANKDYHESGSVSVNQVAYSAKYKVVIAAKNRKNIDLIRPYPQKKDDVKTGEMYYDQASKSFKYAATVEGARVVANIKITTDTDIKETDLQKLLQGIVSKKDGDFDINYGKVVYDADNNQVKYIFIEDSEADATIKVIKLPKHLKGCNDPYKVRAYLYEKFPPNDSAKRLEVTVRKRVGTTDLNVRTLDKKHIDNNFTICRYIARSIFELQMAGGLGLDGKGGNILVKSDENGKAVKAILIDRDTDLLVMESLYNESEYKIDDFEHLTRYNVNKAEQTTMAVSMYEIKKLFNKLFDLHLSSDDEIKNLKTVNSENMKKFYVLSGLFGHLYSVFDSNYFTAISVDYTNARGEKKQRQLASAQGWLKEDIEEVRKHWDKALPKDIAEIMEVDDSKWKKNPNSDGRGFRDSLLDFVTLWKVRDAVKNFTDQDYNKVKQFMNIYYDHLKSKADEKGIQFSDYTNMENLISNLGDVGVIGVDPRAHVMPDLV